MIRIWAKVYTKHKLVKDIIYESIDNFSVETFYVHLQQICHKLDIPTPLVLNFHTKNFIEFNRCFFNVSDFVESVNFDQLVLEDASL